MRQTFLVSKAIALTQWLLMIVLNLKTLHQLPNMGIRIFMDLELGAVYHGEN